MKKLAIITTHPIQYYAPVFSLLAKNRSIGIKVFYTGGDIVIKKQDPGFGKMIEWDIPLLDGYQYEFITNISKNPGSHLFNGIKNPELASKIEFYKPDAILVFGWAYHSHLKMLMHFKGKIPIWFRGDSTLLNENIGITGVLKSMLKKIFLNWVYKHVDNAFYVGENNRSYLQAYGLETKQLIFAPHAVDNKRFSVDRLEEAFQLRKSLNIPESSTVILFAGKLERIKNPLLLIRALSNLKPGNNCHLIIAGNGELEQALKLRAQSNKIHFLNFQNQSQMPVLYQACDLFCLPSKSESWGLAVNEAMACSRAVLVSDKVGCATDLVIPNVNGQIFKSGNLNDLTEKLFELTNDQFRLKEMGQRSKEIIHSFNFEKIASAIEKQLLLSGI